jgi:hypothetical protein
MFCGLDFESPKIDCSWNSAALCAFVCHPIEFEHTKLPRRLQGPRITPEARAPDSRPPTAGRASTPQSGRTLSAGLLRFGVWAQRWLKWLRSVSLLDVVRALRGGDRLRGLDGERLTGVARWRCLESPFCRHGMPSEVGGGLERGPHLGRGVVVSRFGWRC